MAAIVGLEALVKPCQVELYSDSKYLTDAFNQHWIQGWLKRGWKKSDKSPVKNKDLWTRLLAAMEPHQVNFHWVKDMTVIRRMNAVTGWQPQQRMEVICWRMRLQNERTNE